MNDEAMITRINMVLPLLNEAQRRIYLAAETSAIGRDGITYISNLTGVSRVTITAGIKDLKEAKRSCFRGWQNTDPARRWWAQAIRGGTTRYLQAP